MHVPLPPQRRAPIFGRFPVVAVARVTLTTSSLVPGLVLPTGFLESEAMRVILVLLAICKLQSNEIPREAGIISPSRVKERRLVCLFVFRNRNDFALDKLKAR